ncbi:50S ribosomal protein L27 [Candidatus Shapirobacteria bacterium]|nr:50S ribosomal protein L27 [Candidatus Shapirobacteria bacterium]
MAKTKAAGKTKEKSRRPGKRLGVKIFGGQEIKTGQIIVRQNGTKFLPGKGVKVGRDFTLFSLRNGIVSFKKNKGKQVVSVL